MRDIIQVLFQLGTPAVPSYGVHSLQPSRWPQGVGGQVRLGCKVTSRRHTFRKLSFHSSMTKVIRGARGGCAPRGSVMTGGSAMSLDKMGLENGHCWSGQAITGVSTNSTLHSSGFPLLQGEDSSSNTVMLFGADVVRMFLGTNKVICGPTVGQYRPRLKPLIHT